MLVAFLVGLSLMRLKGAYISVATLGFLVIVQVVLVNWDQVTRGARTFAGVPPHTTVWNVWIWAVRHGLRRVAHRGARPFGRDMRAARDNEIAALSLGVSVLRSRLLAFCVSAFLTGVAGSLWAHFITSFSPKSFFFTQAFSIITMLVIGGLGSVSGSVIGVVLITVALGAAAQRRAGLRPRGAPHPADLRGEPDPDGGPVRAGHRVQAGRPDGRQGDRRSSRLCRRIVPRDEEAASGAGRRPHEAGERRRPGGMPSGYRSHIFKEEDV